MVLPKVTNDVSYISFLTYTKRETVSVILSTVLEISLHGPDGLSAYVSFMKAIPMSALLIASFRTHMNREFFYPHLEPIEDNM